MDTTGTMMMAPTGPFGMGGDLGALLIGALLFGGGFGGYGRGAAGAEMAINPQIQGINDRLSTIQNQASTNTISDMITDYAVAANSNNLALNQAVDNTSRDILGSIANLQAASANNNFLTLQSINASQSALTSQNNQIQLNNLDRMNGITTTMLTGFNNTNGVINTGFNQLIMGQNALSSQLAACCCNIQKAICDDGNETRGLINSIRLQDIQGQLSDAKNALINCNQSNYIAGLFQTYLNPPPCNPCNPCNGRTA